MYLRMKEGRYQGEIRDYAPEVARRLLAEGRAEDPYAEPPVIAAAPQAPEAPAEETKKAAPRRRR